MVTQPLLKIKVYKINGIVMHGERVRIGYAKSEKDI